MDKNKVLTELLIEQLESLKSLFLSTNEKVENNRAYFTLVKEKTKAVYQLLDEWEEVLLAWAEKTEKTMYIERITSTKRTMEALILHSYYNDIRKKQYMNMYHSCYYTFSQFMKEFTNETK